MGKIETHIHRRKPHDKFDFIVIRIKIYGRIKYMTIFSLNHISPSKKALAIKSEVYLLASTSRILVSAVNSTGDQCK